MRTQNQAIVLSKFLVSLDSFASFSYQEEKGSACPALLCRSGYAKAMHEGIK